MQVPVWQDIANDSVREEIRAGNQPVVIRGLVKEWQLVVESKNGFDALADYLLKFDHGMPFQAMIAPSSVRGRLFYKDDFTGFNFKRMNGQLSEALKILKSLADHSASPGFYIGSKVISEYLPGLQQEVPLDLIEGMADPTIWIGNSVTVATHNDDSENIACVAAGRRRFTLFPPEQASNLYIGPKDVTPAGRPISLVDISAPDYDKYPRYMYALEHAQVAVLEAGDALYIPTHWWHNVESLESMNILVNFWWKGQPPRL